MHSTYVHSGGDNCEYTHTYTHGTVEVDFYGGEGYGENEAGDGKTYTAHTVDGSKAKGKERTQSPSVQHNIPR